MECVFVKGCLKRTTSLGQVFVLLYVDDFLFASSSNEALSELERDISKVFTAKFTSELASFVGLSFQSTGNVLTLNQVNKIEDLEKEYEIQEPFEKTPMMENLVWSSASTKLTDIRKQQVLLGELSYLNQVSRPDISFAINKIARTTTKATKETYRSLKRVSLCKGGAKL